MRLRKLHQRRLNLAFDGLNPDSLPTPMQEDILKDTVTRVFWIIAANRSGKSQTGGRIVSWWFNNDHPFMERPAEWGAGPLQLLVVGRVGEQMTSELWAKKLKPFLKPGDYKEVKIGNDLKRVENLKNGNVIIFMSHHDATNAREKVQSFTANVVWLDEMPDDAKLVSELLTRALLAGGRLYATFTPLIRNEEIRRIVDAERKHARKIQLQLLDNPVCFGREEEIVAEMRANCSSEAEFRARMYGDWYHGDTQVFSYDQRRNRAVLPEHYSPEWRHIAVADPSASGHTGLLVGAEDPLTGFWHVVKAKYLNGAAAYELVTTIEDEIKGFRLVAKICDCNPAGFYKEAARRNLGWVPYTEKQDRKLETINLVNTWLTLGKLFFAPWLDSLEEEAVLCSWSEKNPDKIAGASRYHLLDCLRYLIDRVPPWDPRAQVPRTYTQELRQAWRKKQDKIAAKVRVHERRSAWNRQRSGSRWSSSRR